MHRKAHTEHRERFAGNKRCTEPSKDGNKNAQEWKSQRPTGFTLLRDEVYHTQYGASVDEGRHRHDTNGDNIAKPDG